jgi:hypothetical protein
MSREFEVGDEIEAIDLSISRWPIYGRILALDQHPHPLQEDYALIEADSPALPPPRVWVSLRLAKLRKD